MKNVIKSLSESKRAEIATLAEQIYQIGFEDGQASTVEGTTVETIEHEGKYLRKVDRVAYEGDYIRPTVVSDSVCLLKGRIYGPVDKSNKVRCIDRMSWNVYEDNFQRTTSTIEVFEVVDYVDEMPLEDVPVILTANQQREKLNQRAREFVEGLKRNGTFDGVEKDYYVNYRRRNSVVEFVVNKEKRTVVAIARNPRIKVINSKGIAKCMPGDVFNEWIGKAIALARALEIDIPQEFIDAVQPDTPVVGQVVLRKKLNSNDDGVRTLIDVSNIQGWFITKEKTTMTSPKNIIKIIDDTNAIYEV